MVTRRKFYSTIFQRTHTRTLNIQIFELTFQIQINMELYFQKHITTRPVLLPHKETPANVFPCEKGIYLQLMYDRMIN